MELLTQVLGSPEFQSALATIVVALFGLLATFITQAIVRFAKTKTENQNILTLVEITRQAVLAAEQLANSGQLSDKKAYALTAVNEYLITHGIKNIPAEAIDAAIEAAVFTNFHQYWDSPVADANKVEPEPEPDPDVELPTERTES